MYSNPLTDLIYLVVWIIIFIAIVAFCCGTDSSSSGSSKPKNTTTQTKSTNTYYRRSGRECPACGAPGYDGLCDECGYPDINQGWLGENF